MTKGITDEAEGDLTQPPVLTARKVRSLQGNVPRHVGWIEPWISGSVAIWIALMVLIGRSYSPALWLCVVVTAALAWWSWRRPARRQTELLLRAASLMLLDFVVLTQTFQNPLVTGNWIAVPLILYALLLQRRLVWSLLGFSLGIYVLVTFLFHTQAVDEIWFLRAAFVFIFSVAATQMGEVMRRTDELLEERRVDTSSGLLNEYGFMDHGRELWHYCRQKRVPATLVLLDVPDLQKIREVYHAGATGMVELKVLEAVGALDVGTHVLARLSMWRFALLMAGTTREQALRLVEASLGRPPVIEMNDGQLNLSFMVKVHALESRRQDVALADFYKTALAALDAQAGHACAGEPRLGAVGSTP